MGRGLLAVCKYPLVDCRPRAIPGGAAQFRRSQLRLGVRSPPRDYVRLSPEVVVLTHVGPTGCFIGGFVLGGFTARGTPRLPQDASDGEEEYRHEDYQEQAEDPQFSASTQKVVEIPRSRASMAPPPTKAPRHDPVPDQQDQRGRHNPDMFKADSFA